MSPHVDTFRCLPWPLSAPPDPQHLTIAPSRMGLGPRRDPSDRGVGANVLPLAQRVRRAGRQPGAPAQGAGSGESAAEAHLAGQAAGLLVTVTAAVSAACQKRESAGDATPAVVRTVVKTCLMGKPGDGPDKLEARRSGLLDLIAEAGGTGLEPATYGFGDRCSAKLSYPPAYRAILPRRDSSDNERAPRLTEAPTRLPAGLHSARPDGEPGQRPRAAPPNSRLNRAPPSSRPTLPTRQLTALHDRLTAPCRGDKASLTPPR